MTSGIVIFDESLQVLVSYISKPLPNLHESIEQFKYAQKLKPVIQVNNYHYIYIVRDGLFFVSISYGVKLVYPMTILSYLNQLYLLIKQYFGHQLNKILIMDNFHLVYELINESIDMGIPQVTNYNVIQDYIKIKVMDHKETESKMKIKCKEKSVDDTYENIHIAKTTTSAISWRPKGIHYGKNEFFLDVIEKLEYVMDLENHQVRNNSINGLILCKSYLSGMPELKVGLNKMLSQDMRFITKMKFHQCVNLNILEKNHCISFIPPDGEFKLCEYKLKRHINDLPVIKLEDFEVIANSERSRVIINLKISTHFKLQDSTNLLNIYIPLKSIFRKYKIDLSYQPRFKCDFGTVMFNITDDYLLWEIGSLKGGHGDKQTKMSGEFHLFNNIEYLKREILLKESMDPPPLREGPQLEVLYEKLHQNNNSIDEISSNLLQIQFEIPYYAVSGLKVEYLTIEENQLNYQSFPWVRYKTINDHEYAYQVHV